jgi:hypothetical protein
MDIGKLDWMLGLIKERGETMKYDATNLQHVIGDEATIDWQDNYYGEAAATWPDGSIATLKRDHNNEWHFREESTEIQYRNAIDSACGY